MRPERARAAWRIVQRETASLIQAAQATQVASRMSAKSRAPPLWAWILVLVLGWNEMVALVRSPLLLVVVVLVGFVVVRVYTGVGVDETLEAHGMVLGTMMLLPRVGPHAKTVVADLLRDMTGWSISAGLTPTPTPTPTPTTTTTTTTDGVDEIEMEMETGRPRDERDRRRAKKEQ